MDSRWRIELFGGLRVTRGERVITRFRRQKAWSLLAYLSYYPHQSHPRDELIELLWPEIDPETGRSNLRVTLYSIRQQLEARDDPAGSVLLTEQNAISLDPAAFTTDVSEFETVLQSAAQRTDPAERVPFLARAAELYRGELLPGFFEPWVMTERQHLAEAHLSALHQLAAGLERAGDLPQALEYARRAVSADPLREEAHYNLMRLYALAGQPSATLKQYQELERLLREELDETPSAATRALAEELRQKARTVVVARSVPAGRANEETGRGGDGAANKGEVGRGLADPPVVPSPPRPLAPSPLLPAQFTRFFGREEEIAQLIAAVRVPPAPRAAGGRLVTITGPGGSGKTRLAIAAAARLQEEYAGTLWFVSLAELSDAERIGEAVVEAIGLPPAPDGQPLEQVIAALQPGAGRSRLAVPSPAAEPRPSLLVLDNFEQLVDGGALAVRYLLERAPSLTVLITSRRRLELEGEREFILLPLPVPGVQAFRCSGVQAGKVKSDSVFVDPEHPNTRTPEHLNALLQFPSIQLFVDRAQAARPDFQLTAENAAAVTMLCDRLEGLPLAIELAAARARVLTPAQILERLDRRFELLVSSRRDVSARHRTLRATLEWSYHLLSPELQQFFAQLSVFRGGWSLETAEIVGAEPLALDCLEQLQQSSLVRAEAAADGAAMRYRMLESLREFAAEQLAPDERLMVQQRHFEYFLRFVEAEGEAALQAGHIKGWLARLEAEDGNLRAALEWGLSAEPAAALRLARSLASYWHVRGHLAEGIGYLRRAAGWEHEETRLERVAVLRYAGEMASAQAEYGQARELLEAGLTVARQIGCHDLFAAELIGASLGTLGRVALAQADYGEARALFQESIEVRRACFPGKELVLSGPLSGLGDVARAEGDLETARDYYEQSLAIFRRENDTRHAAQRLLDLGFLACLRNDPAAAQPLFTESLAVFREFGERAGIALALQGLGEVSLARQEAAAASDHFRESMALLAELGQRREIAGVLESLARWAKAQERAQQAAFLWGAAEALRDAIGAPLPPNEQPDRDGRLEALRHALGETDFAAALVAGRALSWRQAASAAVYGLEFFPIGLSSP